MRDRIKKIVNKTEAFCKNCEKLITGNRYKWCSDKCQRAKK